jgi:hypothetical protein
MLQGLEGSVWLILVMSRDFGSVATKSLADFSQSQAKTKLVYGKNTKHGTAEPLHCLHMGLKSDVTTALLA